jgi:hypothetical protein
LNKMLYDCFCYLKDLVKWPVVKNGCWWELISFNALPCSLMLKLRQQSTPLPRSIIVGATLKRSANPDCGFGNSSCCRSIKLFNPILVVPLCLLFWDVQNKMDHNTLNGRGTCMNCFLCGAKMDPRSRKTAKIWEALTKWCTLQETLTSAAHPSK